MIEKIFISYTQADRAWAEWIGWQIQEAGYEPLLQAWHFGAGSNFVQEMQRAVQEADRTIAVLSPEYERSAFASAEWATAFAQDASGEASKLVPVRVEGYRPSGLLAQIVHIDLVELEESVASERLLEGLRGARPPVTAPRFPGDWSARSSELPRRFPGETPTLWNVPFARNPYFTGRERFLDELARALATDGAAPPGQTRAISGLGGVGKTQTAVEYAYRYRDRYEAVFWVRSDTAAEARSGLTEVAQLLDLPEKDAREEDFALKAVHWWLEQNGEWLLIIDNADNPAELQPLVPLRPLGHTLLTSRAHTFATLSIGEPLQIRRLPRETSVAFLRRRTGRETLDPEEDAAAHDLAEELGDLPLALEQAGAFISQRDSRIQDYLKSYRKRGLTLLNQARPTAGPKHDPVATTWRLNFQAVEEASVASADLLRASAFFAADSIPFELLIEGGSELGETLAIALGDAGEDPLVIDDLLHPLIRYSLIRRNAEARTFSVHQLVQKVLKKSMTEPAAALWAERAIRTVNRAYPTAEFEAWPLCERIQPHAQMTAGLGFETVEMGCLLNQTAVYSWKRGRYSQAEPLFRRSLTIREKILGPEHTDVAEALNNLANLYRDQGRLEEAEPLLQRSLAIREGILDPEHPEVATGLNNLANLYYAQRRLKEATPLYQRSLTIFEEVFGPEDSKVGICLNNMATLYRDQGHFEEAESLFRRSLVIWEKIFGPEHPNVAATLHNLATLYRAQGHLEKAEPLYQQSLALREKVLDPEHPSLAGCLENYAVLLRETGRKAEARKMEVRARRIRATRGKRNV